MMKAYKKFQNLTGAIAPVLTPPLCKHKAQGTLRTDIKTFIGYQPLEAAAYILSTNKHAVCSVRKLKIWYRSGFLKKDRYHSQN